MCDPTKSFWSQFEQEWTALTGTPFQNEMPDVFTNPPQISPIYGLEEVQSFFPRSVTMNSPLLEAELPDVFLNPKQFSPIRGQEEVQSLLSSSLAMEPQAVPAVPWVVHLMHNTPQNCLTTPAALLLSRYSDIGPVTNHTPPPDDDSNKPYDPASPVRSIFFNSPSAHLTPTAIVEEYDPAKPSYSSQPIVPLPHLLTANIPGQLSSSDAALPSFSETFHPPYDVTCYNFAPSFKHFEADFPFTEPNPVQPSTTVASISSSTQGTAPASSSQELSVESMLPSAHQSVLPIKPHEAKPRPPKKSKFRNCQQNVSLKNQNVKLSIQSTGKSFVTISLGRETCSLSVHSKKPLRNSTTSVTPSGSSSLHVPKKKRKKKPKKRPRGKKSRKQ